MRVFAFALMLASLLMQACSSGPEKTWVAGWQETTAMNEVRAGAASVVHNGFVYVIAGVDGKNFLRTTEYAKINADGSLGPWQQGTSLNEERGFTEAVVHGDFVYVVGGGNGPNGQNLLRSVERASINSDGSLGAWIKESHATVLPRRCTKLGLIGNRIYSFGGFGGALLDSVEFTTIKEDGSVGEWQLASETMNLPRYVNSVKAVGGAAYVLGGHDEVKGVGITDVEWTRPTETGDMKGWQPTSPMLTGRYGLSSIAVGDRIYALGGLTGLEYLKSIEMSEVKKAGGLGPWQAVTPLTVPRATFSVAKDNHWVYVIGGTNRDGYLRSVEYAKVNEKGGFGFWATAQERQAHEEKLRALATNTGPALPNTGVVKQVLHTQMYSYIQVAGNNGIVWLAGPKTDLPINAKIRYSKGVYMSNFYSKELQRQFPAVTFVSRIELER
jgi:hypothetical protein